MARQIIYTVAVIFVVNNIVINAKAAPDRTGAIDSASEITEEGYFTVSQNNKEYQLTTTPDPQKYESATGDPDEEIQAPTTTPLPPPTGDSTGTTPISIISNEVKPRLRGYPKYFPEEGLAHPPTVHKPIYYSRPQEDMVPEENNLNYFFTMENECAPLHPAGLCSVPVSDCPEEDGRNYDFVNWKRPYDDSYNGYFSIDEMCPLVDDYC